MRIAITALILFILLLSDVFSQENSRIRTYEEFLMEENPVDLSSREQEALKRVPPLAVPGHYKSVQAPLLPYMVDNSTQPFMRPVFSQVALECGQASGVAYTFTYEMNYRRNLPGNVSANQYPTHYVWNFSNNGASCGVSFLESWEIIRGAGTVNVQDYGGMTTLGANGWLSGYNHYHSAMKNRADYFYSIDVSTAEGITTLKHWIHDHLEGATAGGLATFAAYATGATILPNGTPEGGKCVTVDWTYNTNHQLVIVGYNDSIRFDFNSDGLFTNDIDINGDGIVDVKDWEIGGVKWVNSFGTGTGNGGYCYTMYKNLADPKNQGGIWNNTVYVIIPKPDYQPRLAYKVNLMHDCRSKIKVVAGVSMDTNSVTPAMVLEFPVFNYQGGEYYMQGGTTTQANKTLEFGLDVTPLLSQVLPGSPARFFLMVNEKDLYQQGTGTILNWSIMDYTPSLFETAYPGTNIPLVENGLTSLYMNKAVNFPQVYINDASLPDAILYQDYEHQLTASGGTAPYTWEMMMDYSENLSTLAFSPQGGQQLSPSSNVDGLVSQALDFDFPFYGKKYNRVVVRVDGYLMFDDQALPWPFIVDEGIYQRNTKNIAAFLSKAQVIAPSEGDGIWYTGDQNSATFRWKTSVINLTASTDLNYAITLHADGRIDLHYGDLTFPDYLPWVSGIASGDLFNYHLTQVSGQLLVTPNQQIALVPDLFPLGLTLSKSGKLSGTLMQSYVNSPVKFMVSDKYDMRSVKVLPFSTRGVEIITTILSGSDSLIQYGETANVSIFIKNASTQALVNPLFHLELADPYLSLTDSLQAVPSLQAGDTLTITNAFQFTVAQNIPNKHSFNMHIYTPVAPDTLGRVFTRLAYSPDLKISGIQVMDAGNGYLEPGETCNILVSISNQGGADALNLNGSFSTTDPYLGINAGIAIIPSLLANTTGITVINVSASPSAPPQHLAPVQLSMSGNMQVSLNANFYLLIGTAIENFENGNFTLFNWQMAGDQAWYIRDSLPYEGTYCAQSGDIDHLEESILFVGLTIQTPGPVSFYRRVSCEPDPNNHNYDFLAYLVDGAEKQRWDGSLNWEYASHPVTTGYHTFTWKYHKDYSVSTGKDAAWVDLISFPPYGDITTFSHDEIHQYSVNCTPAPNPFREGTTFFFYLPEKETVSLSVFDVQGRLINTLLQESKLDQGYHHITWNASASGLQAGIYFYRLHHGKRSHCGKLVKQQ